MSQKFKIGDEVVVDKSTEPEGNTLAAKGVFTVGYIHANWFNQTVLREMSGGAGVSASSCRLATKLDKALK